MKPQNRKVGNIKIPRGLIVQPHELSTAVALSWTGNDVEFIPARTIATPDIEFMGREWEIKSPVGSSSRTIENNLRNALRQSTNIVIDLSRIKQAEEKALREIRRQHKLIKTKHQILVVTKSRQIINL